MTKLSTPAVQLGDNANPAHNFTLRTNNDGTLTLARGNVGSTTQDLLMIDAAGVVSIPGLPGVAAMVCFDGTRNVTNTGASTNGQPVYLKRAVGVTSVVKNATGDYTLNFGPLSTAHYTVAFGSTGLNTANIDQQMAIHGTSAAGATLKTTTQLRVQNAGVASFTAVDGVELNVTIFV